MTNTKFLYTKICISFISCFKKTFFGIYHHLIGTYTFLSDNEQKQFATKCQSYLIKEVHRDMPIELLGVLTCSTVWMSYYWIPVLIFWNKLHKDNYNKKSLQNKKKELTSKLYKTNISFLNEEANNIEDRYLRDKVIDKEALHFARSAAWIWAVPFALVIIINIIKNINENRLKRLKRLKGQKRKETTV